MNKKNKARVAFADAWLRNYLACALLVLLAPFSQAATLTPEVQAGLDWLNAQVLSRGDLSGEAASIATSAQSRTETLQTTSGLGATNAALADAVGSLDEDSTENLARRAIALATANRAATAPIEQLRLGQNTDGGWGDGRQAPSNPLDTAWAVIAFRVSGFSDGNVLGNAVNYLSSSISADGGFATPRGDSQAYVTSYALLALESYRSIYNLTAPIAKAQLWLQSHQSGGQYGDSLHNALAVLALSRVTSDTNRYGGALSALKAAQRSDGSWNGDVYVTSLALRALVAYGQSPPPSPTSGRILGQVNDASSASAIAGAIVSLGGQTASTDALGSFLFATMLPGPYTASVSKDGYAPASFTVSVVAGSSSNVGTISLGAAPDSAILRGQITDGVTGQALAGVIVTVSRAGQTVASTSTSSTGNFQLAGLAPGQTELTAALNGYQTVNTVAEFAAGGVYIYSPALYGNGQTTPTTATLQGTVVDAGSGLPLSGATISVGADAAVTAADGYFSLPGLTPGSVQIQINASGYQSVQYAGTLSAGINRIGELRLSVTPTSVTLRGIVTDGATGAPIAGAGLSVEGANLQTTTDSSGRYVIESIPDKSFTLVAEAPGYLSSTSQVSVPDYGTYTADFTLGRTPANGLELSITTNLGQYDPFFEVEIQGQARNTTAQAKSLNFTISILDPQRNSVAELQALPFLQTSPPPSFQTVPANGTLDVMARWYTLDSPAGQYTAVLRARNEEGVVVAEAGASFAIIAKQALSGGLALDPPIAQAGTAQPIKIDALLTNAGNLDLPAGPLNLEVVLDHPDLSVPQIIPAKMKALWEGSPLASPRGMAYDSQGNLLVANAAGNRAVLRISASGQSTQVASLPSTVSPVDLILDSAGTIYVLGSANNYARITPAGVVTVVSTAPNITQQSFDIDSQGNLFILGTISGARQLVRLSPAGVRTVVVQSGLSSPVDAVYDTDGSLYISNYGDNSIGRFDAQGRLSDFVTTGLNRPQGIVRDTQGNLIVANSGANNLVKITPQGGVSVFASGLSNPYFMDWDLAGNLLVANSGNNNIAKVSPSGTVTTFARSIASAPQGISYDSSGNLFIANANGSITRLDTQEQVSTITTSISTNPRDLEIAANNDLYAANFSAGTLSRVVPSTGATSTFASGFSLPFGLAFDSVGDLMVTEGGANRLTRVSPAGVKQTAVQSFLNAPNIVLTDATGNTFVLNSSSLALIPQTGTGNLLVSSLSTLGTPFGMTLAPQGGVYILFNLNKLVHVSLTGVTTTVVTFAQNFRELATGPQGTVYLTDNSLNRVYRLDASNQPVLLATTAAYPAAIAAGPDGVLYASLNSGALVKISSSGTVTSFVAAGGQGRMTVAADNTVYLVASSLVRKITAAGVATTISTGLNNARGVSLDMDGTLLVTISNTNILSRMTTAGMVTAQYAGFSSPQDIEWAGDRFYFFDGSSRILSWVPGGNPQFHATVAGAYMHWNGSALLVASSTGIRQVLPNGSVSTYFQASISLSGITGISQNAAGTASFALTTDSRVHSLNAAKELVASYAGLNTPTGLSVAADGQVYVSNATGGNVLRLSSNGSQATVVAAVSSPRALRVEPSGNVLVTSQISRLSRMTPQGTLTQLALDTEASLYGIAVQGGAIRVVDNNNALRELSGSSLPIIASGLGNGAVRFGADGILYVAGGSQRGITRLIDDKLALFSTAANQISRLIGRSGGGFFAATSTPALFTVSSSGVVGDVGVAPLMSGFTLGGLAAAPDDTITTLVTSRSAVYQTTLPGVVDIPAAGTVVFSRSLNAAGVSLRAPGLDLDFGQWTPEYAGDYQLRVSSPQGIAGAITGSLHVGPHAKASLAIDRSTVAPGDASVQVSVEVLGADFTSLTKVDRNNLREVATSTRPLAMGADAAGNIYFSDASFVKRIAPGGTTTTVYTGGTLTSFGTLPVDAQQNVYVANTLGKIIQIRPDNSSAIFASAPASTFKSLVIDRQGNLYASTNDARIYKITPQGAVILLPTPSLGSIYAITIDGADNLYALAGTTNVITRIAVDGTAEILLAEPIFEFEGMPLAGDCANNLIIAPYSWSKVAQAGEEYTLAQIFGGSTSTGIALNGNSTLPKLTDMDHLVYDHFGGALLIWTDVGGNPIYRLPISCGAISVDFHLVLPAGQSASGFSQAPSSTLALTDGRSELVWNLQDVTNFGNQFSFDTVVRDLKLGDSRAVASEAFLVFKNSFAAGDVRVPVMVPAIATTGKVELSASTDRASYPAATDVLSDISLSNLTTIPLAGTLRVILHDASGLQVSELLTQDMNLEAAGLTHVYPPFNTGELYAAGYTLVATFSDSSGLLQDTAQASIQIGADSTASAIKSRLSTNKSEYGSYDPVRLVGRAISNTSNFIYEDLLGTLTIQDPSGGTVFTAYRPIDQLPPGATANAEFLYPLDGNTLGAYSASYTVTDAQSRELTRASASFMVKDDLSVAITGDVTAALPVLIQGQPQTCTDSVTNQGTRSVTDLQIRRAVSRLDLAGVVSTAVESLNLAAGSTETLTRGIATTSYENGEFACSLEAFIDQQWKALDHAVFKVSPEPTRLALSVAADRASYDVTDIAVLTSTAQSLMQYRTVRGATLSLEILTPQGASAFNQVLALDDLNPGATLGLPIIFSFNNLAEGVYTVRTRILDATGQSAINAETQIELRKSLARALTGQVQAATPSAVQGDAQSCTDYLYNSSIYAHSGIASRHVLSRLNPLDVVEVAEYIADIAASGSTVMTHGVLTGPLGAGDYLCSLETSINNAWVTLATAPFSITPELAKFSLTIAVDKPHYDSADQVVITSDIQSLMLYRAVQDARLVLEVSSAEGAVVFSHETSVPTLAPGTAQQISDTYAFASLAEGTYSVKGRVLDGGAAVEMVFGDTRFEVKKSINTAVTGSVTAANTLVQQGEAQSCTDTVYNSSIHLLGSTRLRQSLERNGQAPVSSVVSAHDIPAQGQIDLTRDIPSASLIPGEYRCVLEVEVESGWKEIGFAGFTLALEPISLSNTVVTDKALYDSTDETLITSRVLSQMEHRRLSGLTMHLDVVAPDGAVAFVQETPLAELLPGASAEVQATFRYAGVVEGMYVTHSKVLDSGGAILAASENQYEVRTSVSRAISGSVTARYETLAQTETQTCTDTISNASQYAISGLLIRQRLTRTDQPQTLSTTPGSVSLSGKGSQTLTRVFSTDGLVVGGRYACVLEAFVNDQWQQLGSAGFTVLPPPIRLDVSLSLGSKGRLLVLMDATSTGQTDGEAPPTTQRSFLENLLKSEGWSYVITTDPVSFARELHTGQYGVYALFSEIIKLDGTVQKELREAVYRGEGLLEAGSHDQRNSGFDDALGVKYIGKANGVTGADYLGSTFFSPGYADLVLRDKALQADLAGAQKLARYLGGNYTPSTDSAVTAYSYGEGKSVYYGYDLLAEATQAGNASLHTDGLKKALVHLQPVIAGTVAGQVVPIRLTVRNLGVATQGRALLTLPTGTQIKDTGGASLENGKLVWNFNLNAGQEQIVTAYLRLPAQTGGASFSALIQTGTAPNVTDRANANLTLSLQAKPGLAEARALASSNIAYKKVQLWLEKADLHLKAGQYLEAIGDLVKASDECATLSGASVHSLRLMIDQALRNAGAAL